MAAPKLPAETLAWLANADQADAALKDIPGAVVPDSLGCELGQPSDCMLPGTLQPSPANRS